MIENVVHQMGGIGIFGLISIGIFFGFFVGMLLWTAGLKKSYLNSMKALPLEPEPTPVAADVRRQAADAPTPPTVAAAPSIIAEPWRVDIRRQAPLSNQSQTQPSPPE